MRRITWPAHRGKFLPHMWPWFAYLLCNLYGCTIKVNRVMHQNSVWPCVKDHIAIHVQVQNHISLELDGKMLPRSFSATTIWQHLGQFLAIFWLCVRRNGYLWVSGENFDTGIRFHEPDFLAENDISGTWRRFLLIFVFDMQNVHVPHFYFLFAWPTDPQSVTFAVFFSGVENFHHLLSWYDPPLPSYNVLADTLRGLVTLTFDFLTLVSGHTWRVTWSTLPPRCKKKVVFYTVHPLSLEKAPTAICSWVLTLVPVH